MPSDRGPAQTGHPGSDRTWPALDVRRAQGTASVSHSLENDGRLQAALAGFDIAAIEEGPDAWRVYFQSPTDRDRALQAITSGLPDLSCTPVDVPDEDWAARSQADMTRREIGRIIVAPPWDVPLVITIQPSMGFGTGHHATTRLCLAALQAGDVKGRTVLDVGTGSAVLAIAASLLGAADVTGIDDDGDAIRAAWENLALNPGASVTLLVGDVRNTELTAADIVLANLTGGLLTAAASRLQRLVSPGGRLILSGFLDSEEAAVLAAFAGWTIEHRVAEEGWICATLS